MPAQHGGNMTIQEAVTITTAPGATVRRCLINPDERRDYYAIFGPGGDHIADVSYTTILAFAAGDLTLEQLADDYGE